MLETLHDGNNRVTIPISEDICQSYTGRLIKIDHYISITAKTPARFTSPKIHIPIEIVSPRDKLPQATLIDIGAPTLNAPLFDCDY